jgi:hypothetical protein
MPTKALKNAFKIGGKTPTKAQAKAAVADGDARWVTIKGRRVLVKGGGKGSSGDKKDGKKKATIKKKSKKKMKKKGLSTAAKVGIGVGVAAAGAVGVGVAVKARRDKLRDERNEKLRKSSRNLAVASGLVAGLTAGRSFATAAKLHVTDAGIPFGFRVDPSKITSLQKASQRVSQGLAIGSTVQNLRRDVSAGEKIKQQFKNTFSRSNVAALSGGLSVGIPTGISLGKKMSQHVNRGATTVSEKGFKAAKKAKNVTPELLKLVSRAGKENAAEKAVRKQLAAGRRRRRNRGSGGPNSLL